ncbi:hypothetical protein N9C66_04975 [Akkermansiaceae bacterium]|nr:hypothetical protein [Akkermansiaceae bacterium]
MVRVIPGVPRPEKQIASPETADSRESLIFASVMIRRYRISNRDKKSARAFSIAGVTRAEI